MVVDFKMTKESDLGMINEDRFDNCRIMGISSVIAPLRPDFKENTAYNHRR